MTQQIPYKRVLLKLSGEMLMGDASFGINYDALQQLAIGIKDIRNSGHEVALVIGGGNIFRGVNLKEFGIERTAADQIGMLSTLINGIALQQMLSSIECPAKVMSALECPRVADSYNWSKAQEYLFNGFVLIFVGGTGNPYFTTDTAAAMRASEIHADILLKATKVDGIYNKDPLKYDGAIKYHHMTYSQFLAEKLEVMDSTAIALCMNNNIPIFVFNMHLIGKNSLTHILSQEGLGTFVKAN